LFVRNLYTFRKFAHSFCTFILMHSLVNNLETIRTVKHSYECSHEQYRSYERLMNSLPDLISLLILLFFLLLLEWSSSKSLKLCCFKSDPDEIWQECLGMFFTHPLTEPYFQFGVTVSWRHFTQKSAATWWVNMRLPVTCAAMLTVPDLCLICTCCKALFRKTLFHMPNVLYVLTEQWVGTVENHRKNGKKKHGTLLWKSQKSRQNQGSLFI